MADKSVRVKLDLSDFVEGAYRFRWMHLTKKTTPTIGDLVKKLKSEFGQCEAGYELVLYLEKPFCLPLSESTVDILGDGDLVVCELVETKRGKKRPLKSDSGRSKRQCLNGTKAPLDKKAPSSSSSSESEEEEEQAKPAPRGKDRVAETKKSLNDAQTPVRKEASSSSSSSESEEEEEETKPAPKSKDPVTENRNEVAKSSSSSSSSSDSEDDEKAAKSGKKGEDSSDSSSSSDSDEEKSAKRKAENDRNEVERLKKKMIEDIERIHGYLIILKLGAIKGDKMGNGKLKRQNVKNRHLSLRGRRWRRKRRMARNPRMRSRL